VKLARVLSAALLALAGLGCGRGDDPGRSAPSPAEAERRPSVVLVTIDTLRPDHLACYGHSRETAPFLSELALRARVFREASSTSSWTAPATASLFTALHPTQHGVLEGFFVNRRRTSKQGEAEAATVSLNRLPAAPTLPEHFASAGWSTFAVTCNVNVTSRIGFDRGFGRFRDLTGPEHGKGGSAETVLAQLREWKDELSASAPYFLYLHLNDVHSPWRDRGSIDRGADEATRARQGYEGEIRYADAMLRRAYDELGWERDAILCVVSDHGEEFHEHGGTGHGATLYGELTRIVLIVAWPGRWSSGRFVDAPASLVDVYPTLADLAGAPFRPGLAGRSLVPVIEGAAEPEPERPLFAHRLHTGTDKQLWSIVRGRWKLIESVDGVELYDLAADPRETEDLSAGEAARVAALRRELEEFRRSAQPVGAERVDVELDAKQLEALRELGYTDEHR
jgi:choline-sulfatase